MRSRSLRHSSAIELSEAELVRTTRELDELHHDSSMPAMRTAVAEWIEANDERHAAGVVSGDNGLVSRRGLLAGAGVAALGGLVLAACGSSSSTAGPSQPSPSAAASLTGDLRVAGLAASLENLGVFAYGAGISAATAGKLGKVPPAIVTFATTAMAQHIQHAAAWNSVITANGKAKVTETDPALTPVVKQKFAHVTDVAGLAALALEIEDIAAATYQGAILELSSAQAIATAASIQPVEMQHSAILNLVLGSYPVPNAFSPTSLARPTSDLAI